LLLHYAFDGVSLSLKDLTYCEYVANGQTCSESTTKRSIVGLEKAGYLRRVTLRLGPDRFCVKIIFSEKMRNLYAQMCDTSPQRSKCIEKEDLTSITIPQDSYLGFLSDTNAHADDLDESRTSRKKKSTEDKPPEYDPAKPKSEQPRPTRRYLNKIIFALDSVVERLIAEKNLTRGQGEFAVSRARVELASPDIEYHSGVQWEYWVTRWPELARPEQYRWVELEILPKLMIRAVPEVDVDELPAFRAVEDRVMKNLKSIDETPEVRAVEKDADFLARLQAAYEAGDFSKDDVEALIRARQDLLFRRSEEGSP